MAAKKSASKGTDVSISAEGHNISKLTLNMPVDAKKVAAIQKCIAKGSLRITLSKVDLATGRLGDGWLYD